MLFEIKYQELVKSFEGFLAEATSTDPKNISEGNKEKISFALIKLKTILKCRKRELLRELDTATTEASIFMGEQEICFLDCYLDFLERVTVKYHLQPALREVYLKLYVKEA